MGNVVAKAPAWMDLAYNPAEKRDADGKWTKDETRAWLGRHPVSSKNVVDMYHQSTPGEREAGQVWYPHAHMLAQALGKRYGVSTREAAGLLATYSPQTGWGKNIREAAEALREGRPLGGPGESIWWTRDPADADIVENREGVMAPGTSKKRAAAILAGDDPEEVFAGGRNKNGSLKPNALKIRAFANLIANGTQADPEHPAVVIDRHAAGVARGVRMSEDDYTVDGPSSSMVKFSAYSKAYTDAARILSKELGRPVAPEEVQATTWLTRQRLNEGRSQANGRTDTRLLKNYVDQYLPEAVAVIPQVGTADLAFHADEPRDPHTGRWIKSLSPEDNDALAKVLSTKHYDIDHDSGTLSTKPGQKAVSVHLKTLPVGAKFKTPGGMTYTKADSDPAWIGESGAEITDHELAMQNNLNVGLPAPPTPKHLTAEDLKALPVGAKMTYDSLTGTTTYTATKYDGANGKNWHSAKDGWMTDEELAAKGKSPASQAMAVASMPIEGDVITANFKNAVSSYSGQYVMNQPWVFKNGTWQTISLMDGKPHGIDVDKMISMLTDSQMDGSAFTMTVGPPKATNPAAVLAAADYMSPAEAAIHDAIGKMDPSIGIPEKVSGSTLALFQPGDKFAVQTLGGTVHIFQKVDDDNFHTILKSGKMSKTPPVTAHKILKSYKSLVPKAVSSPAPGLYAPAKPKVPVDVTVNTYSVKGLVSPGDDKFPQIVDGSDVAKVPAPGTNAREYLKNYTEDWADEVNSALRNVAKSHGDLNDEGYGLQDKVDDFDSGFHPSKQPVTLYRSVPAPADFDTMIQTRDERIGKTFTDPGYSSTSWDGDRYQSGFIMKIHAPKGTPAMNAEAVSSYDSEHEITLGRGMKYRVDNIRKVANPNGGLMTVVDATVVGKNPAVYRHIKKVATEDSTAAPKVSLKKKPWEMGPHSKGNYTADSPLSQFKSSMADAPDGSVVVYADPTKSDVTPIAKHLDGSWVFKNASGDFDSPEDDASAAQRVQNASGNDDFGVQIIKPMEGAPDYGGGSEPPPWTGATNLIQPPDSASADYWRNQLIDAPVGAKIWSKSGTLLAEKRETGWWNMPTDSPALPPLQMSKNLAQYGGYTMAWGLPDKPKPFHPKPATSASQKAKAAGMKPSASALPLLKALAGKKPTTTPLWNKDKTYNNLPLLGPGAVLYDPEDPSKWYVKGQIGWQVMPTGEGITGNDLDLLVTKNKDKGWRTYI